MRLADVPTPVSEEVDELDSGTAGVTFVVSFGRRSCLRPARLVTKYSHARPRFPQRAQTGFSLLHLTLEAAHVWQLSRSLGGAGTLDRRAGAGRVSTSGERSAAIFDGWGYKGSGQRGRECRISAEKEVGQRRKEDT